MRNTLRVPLIVIMTVGAFMLLLPVPEQRSAAGCRESLSRHVTKLVREDYLKSRFPYWQIEKKLLGTITPQLSFGKVTIENESYRVPFTAQGPASTLTRMGVVNCALQEIDYVYL